jgi:hypothetical protein
MPTFVCTFDDGETTRMPVHCRNGLDVARGVILARHAYASRTGKAPPTMAKATFVSSDDGTVLKTYGPGELHQAVSFDDGGNMIAAQRHLTT